MPTRNPRFFYNMKYIVLYVFAQITLMCLTALGSVYAQEPDTSVVLLPSTVAENTQQELWIDQTEAYLANSVHDFGRYLDHSLAKQEDEEALTNLSYLRLKLKSGYTHRGYFDADESVALRIDLPHLKKNWGLILETDLNDHDSLENKQRGLPDQNAKRGLDGTIGGVRLLNEQWRHWRTDLDFGVKIKLPVDPFAKVKLRRVEPLSADWIVQFKQELFYYHSIGGGALTELNFYYSDNADLSEIVKASSSAQYLYNKDNWEVLFQLQYFDRINDKHLMEYSSGVTIEPNKNDEISNAWISAAWKQKIYKNWLYLYITPQVNAPREFNHKLNPGILMELEIFFSKHRKWDRLNRSIPQSTRVAES